MRRPSIHTTRQFAILSGVICALVLVPSIVFVFWLAQSRTIDVLLFAFLIGIALGASAIVGLGIAYLFRVVLRQLLSSLQRSTPLDLVSEPSVGDFGTLFTRLGDFWARLATDQESLRRRNSELEVLATVSRALNSASSLREMLETVLVHVSDFLPYRKGYVALAAEDTGVFHVLANRGYKPEEIAEVAVPAVHDNASGQSVHLSLRHIDKTIGILYLDGRPRDQSTWRILNLLTDILATSVEKHRLLEAARREVRAQTLLNKAGRVLTSTLDKQEVLTRIMGEVIEALNAEAGSILLVDEEKGDLYFAAAASPAADRLVGMRMSLDQGIVGWTIKHRESVLTDDASVDPRFYGQIGQRIDFTTEALVCVPLISKDKVIGAIEVMNPRSGRFRQHDLRLLESLSPQAAIAIENAFLFESAKSKMAEIERTQLQLLQAEKLSAIGRLVAGVAHELNNPLTAIVGYAQLLLDTDQEPEVRDDLERINREAQRSARIVQNLLAFARQQKLEKHPIDLGGALTKTISLLGYQLEVDNIRLVNEISEESSIVLGDTYQLQQVFLNLITNAHQAMRKAHGRGTLIIRTLPAGDQVRVQFIDDGPGIPKDIVGSIFDPFFTTKDIGEGTGLGLSICMGIIQEHEGQIWVESEPGHGAVFTVELPLYEGDSEEGRMPAVVEDAAPLREQSILVVDDEIAITQLLKRILETSGHAVVAANSGAEALEVMDDQSFDVVICDLKMPGMDGRELYAHLKHTRPDLAERVIFSTGDTVSAESWTFLQEVENRFINKPFNPQQVLAEIGELLAE